MMDKEIEFLGAGVRYNEVVVTDARTEALSQAAKAAGFYFGIPANRVIDSANGLPDHARVVCAPALARPEDVEALISVLEAAL